MLRWHCGFTHQTFIIFKNFMVMQRQLIQCKKISLPFPNRNSTAHVHRLPSHHMLANPFIGILQLLELFSVLMRLVSMPEAKTKRLKSGDCRYSFRWKDWTISNDLQPAHSFSTCSNLIAGLPETKLTPCKPLSSKHHRNYTSFTASGGTFTSLYMQGPHFWVVPVKPYRKTHATYSLIESKNWLLYRHSQEAISNRIRSKEKPPAGRLCGL